MSQFEWQVRVYYEDTDSGGVVYYANYLRFMERARTEWLRGLGIEQDRLIEEHDILFAVRQVSIDYHAPARFNDLLTVSTGILARSRASLTFGQTVTRAGESGHVLCSAQVKVACLAASTFRASPLPDFILKEIPDVV
ncbi:MAG: tol-pal system-associated acyl-CoA thioesterase [Gammaproteobacteria bacterium]